MVEEPQHEAEQTDQQEDFLWIQNEGLLGDEGVVFGLGAGDESVAYKEECIRAYYRRQVAHTARERGALQHEIDRLRERIGELTAQAGALTAPAATVPAEAGYALVWRYGLGIAAAALACAGTATLVFNQLRPELQAAGVVTLGVVAAGFFTAFLPVSVLFVNDGDERPGNVELWKVRLAEVGMPLVATAFVTTWAWPRLGPARALATAALLFLVFTFAGRQILSSVPRLGESLRRVRDGRASDELARENARRAAAMGEEAARMHAREAELRREAAALPSDAEWDAVRDGKLALFRSEYELARASQGRSPLDVRLHVPSTNGSR